MPTPHPSALVVPTLRTPILDAPAGLSVLLGAATSLTGLGLETYVVRAAGTGLDSAASIRAAIAAATGGALIFLPDPWYELRTASGGVAIPIDKPNIWLIGAGRTRVDNGVDPLTGGTTALEGRGVLGNIPLIRWYADQGTNTTDATSQVYGGGLLNLSVSGQATAQYCVEIQCGCQGLRLQNVHLAHCTASTVIIGTGCTHSGSNHLWHSAYDIVIEHSVLRAFGTSHALHLTGNPNVAGGEDCYNIRINNSNLLSVNGDALRAEDADDVFLTESQLLPSGTGAPLRLMAPTATKAGGGARNVIVNGLLGGLAGITAVAGASGSDGSSRQNLLLGVSTEDHPGIPTIEKGSGLYYVADTGQHNLRRDSRTSCELVDDFLGGNTGSAAIGDLRWFLTNGTISFLDSEAEHPGIVRQDSSAVATTLSSVYIKGSGTIGLLLPAEAFDVEYIFRVNTVDTDTMSRVGLMMSPTGNPGNNGMFLEKLYADTNWFVVTRSGGAQTRTDTGLVVTAGQWVRLRIRRRSPTSIGFSIPNLTGVTNENDTWKHTANIPTVTLNAMWQIQTQALASKTQDLDRFGLYFNGLNR